MRSQKQVRRVGKVRSLKNAVAGKRKTCRKRLEARKTWQHNTIMTKRRSPNNLSVLLPTTHKKIKEPKQRSAEELAERQRLREQKRLDKELAKQKASTSALPKIKKEKTEQTQPTVNLQQQAADARKTSEQKAKKQQKSEVKSQSNQKLLMEEKGNRMEVPEGYKKSKPPTPKMSEEKALVQSKTTMKEDDQNEMGRRMAEEMNKKQKKKRNRRSDAGYRLSDNDFIEGDAHEIDEGKANTDFTEIVGRNFKKKGHYVDQQSRYEESFFEVKKEQEHVGRGGKDSVNEVLAPPTEDQNYFLVGPRFKTEGTVDHITLSNNEITKDDDETILKTEVSTEALSLSKELQMNMAKRAGEHPELLSTTIHDLNGAVNGKMTLKTYTKEAEREMNVEKREPIVLALERDNARRVQPVRERVYKLLPRDVQFCVRMIEKHGEDYEAMAEDEGNTFRDSAKGIARKIRIFKGSPQYEAYLKQKDDQKGPVS